MKFPLSIHPVEEFTPGFWTYNVVDADKIVVLIEIVLDPIEAEDLQQILFLANKKAEEEK